MTRLLTALMLSGLMAFAQSSPQTSTASPAPTPSSQNQTQEPTGNLTPKGSTLSNVIKVCGPQSPPPCATAPQLVKSPEPKYSKEARKKKVQGTTLLWLVVGADGVPRDI